MTFDTVLEEKVGALGRWQFLLFFLVILPTSIFPAGMIPQLANLSPPYICSGPWFEGWTYDDVVNVSKEIESLQQRFTGVRNKTLTLDFKCQRYNLSDIEKSLLRNTSIPRKQREVLAFAASSNLSLGSCPGPWLFDSANAPYRVSLIESFEMVCHRWFLIPNTAVLYIIGRFIGMSVGGQLGDRFGRRLVVCIGFSVSAVISMLVFFCSSPLYLFFLRLAIGLGAGLGVSSANVFFIEITNHRHRNTLNVLSSVSYIVGLNVAILTSYVLQDWRWVHFVFGVIVLSSAFLTFLFLPESPRWLVARGRNAEALAILRKGVVMNGGSREVADSISPEDLALSSDASDHKGNSGGFRQWAVFFISPKSVKRWLPLSIIWIATGEVYYGISYYNVRLQGNPYLISFGMGFSGLPSMLIEWILYEKFDRKRPIIGLLGFAFLWTIGALVGKVTGAPGVIIVVLATLVFVATSMLFDMMYLTTPELFPTLYRANALGFLTSICRFGVVGGMFVERLGGNWPLVIFSVTLAVAIGSSLLLPRGDYRSMEEGSLETKGRRSSGAGEDVVMMTQKTQMDETDTNE